MAKTTKTYKQLTDELNELLAWFESDEVELEQALAKYEQALALIDQLEEHLKSAQNKITKINAKFGV